MKSIQKIAIIGAPGTGKSTLAEKLHTTTQLPVFHLDQYFWHPNWQHPDEDAYKKIHDTIHDKKQWIIDGMNLKYLESRIQKADLIIFLDYPRHIYMSRIIKRMIQNYGKTGPHSAPGCNEKFNLKFLKFFWWVIQFKKNYMPIIQELMEKYSSSKQIVRIKKPQRLAQELVKINL